MTRTDTIRVELEEVAYDKLGMQGRYLMIRGMRER